MSLFLDMAHINEKTNLLTFLGSTISLKYFSLDWYNSLNPFISFQLFYGAKIWVSVSLPKTSYKFMHYNIRIL